VADLGEWLASQAGQPIPCSICQAPTPSAQLRETLLPGALAFDGEIVVQSVGWVCPSCPGEEYLAFAVAREQTKRQGGDVNDIEDFDITKLLSLTNPRTGASLTTLGMTGRQVRDWMRENGTDEDEWQCVFHPDVTLT
jgi:hypothetical protein